MKLALQGLLKARSGFTLLEMMVALTIFGAVGYSLMVTVKVGNHSQKAVARVISEDRSLRSATSSLIDELRASSDTTITVTHLADGNHQVRFMQPIDVAGVASWGVYDRSFGNTPASQNKQAWSIQYTVRSVAGNGTVNRQLLRQILDDTLAVREEKVIAEGLRSGTDVPPGFTMVKTGAVWELKLSTVGESESTAGMKEVFHVQTRN